MFHKNILCICLPHLVLSLKALKENSLLRAPLWAHSSESSSQPSLSLEFSWYLLMDTSYCSSVVNLNLSSPKWNKTSYFCPSSKPTSKWKFKFNWLLLTFLFILGCHYFLYHLNSKINSCLLFIFLFSPQSLLPSFMVSFFLTLLLSLCQILATCPRALTSPRPLHPGLASQCETSVSWDLGLISLQLFVSLMGSQALLPGSMGPSWSP